MKSTAHTMKTNNPETMWKHRGCAVCNGAQTRVLFRQRFVPMSEGSLLTGYNVAACGQCGFCYSDHLPEQEAFDRYYRDMSKYEQPAGPSKPSEADLQRFRSTVEKIKRFLPDPNARIFEIGCATGLLLSELKNAGYRNVSGLDPSPACRRAAEELYGIQIQCGALSDELATDSVELLILVGVLEHIRDLDPALKKMCGLLGKHGKVFITVPDASQYAAGDDAPFQEFSLEHINYFGPGSLINIMAKHGFRCLFTEQGMQRQNARTVTPVVHAAFEKLPVAATAQWTKDLETPRGLDAYVARSKRENQALQPVLNELAESRTPVIIWGAGSHTLRLLATSRLAEANVTAIVDSNPRYHGKNVNGAPIVKPEAIRGMPGTILISSRPFQEDIRTQIKTVLKLEHDVVTLYPLETAAEAELVH